MWGSIIGAGIGAAASLLGGREKSQTVTQNTDPWGPQQGYLTDIFGQGQKLYQQGAFPGPYTAPWSPFSSQAASNLGTQAMDPNNLVAQAQRNLGATIGGDYLNVDSNPYLQGAVQTGLNQVRQNVNQQFGGENFGSSANQGWLMKQGAEYALPIYAQNYARERQNQLTALGMAPSLQAANIAQLGQAGNIQDVRAEQERAGAERQFYSPWDVLARYQGAVSGNYGGTRNTTSPYYYNPWTSMLGGGLAGAQIGKQIGGWFSSGGGSPYEPDYGIPYGSPGSIYE